MQNQIGFQEPPFPDFIKDCVQHTKRALHEINLPSEELLLIEYLIYDGGARIRFWVPPSFPGN